MRYGQIDGIRGLAAISIVIYHFQHYFYTGQQFFKIGFSAVDLFFILSGFIISFIYSSKVMSRETLFFDFFFRRVARLWPLHVFALLTIFIVHHTMKYFSNYPLFGDASMIDFFLNMFFLQNIYPFSPGLWNPPSWSITTEIVINIIWFVMLRLGFWRRIIIVPLVVFGSIILWDYSHGTTINVLAQDNLFGYINLGLMRTFIGFSIGTFIFDLYKNQTISKLSSLSLHFASFLAIFCYCLLAYYFQVSRKGLDFILVLIVFPLFVISIVDGRSLIAKALSSRPMKFLGLISYSVYLLQVPVFHVVGSYGADLAKSVTVHWTQLLGVTATFALIITSTLTFFVVEKPCRIMIQRWWGSNG